MRAGHVWRVLLLLLALSQGHPAAAEELTQEQNMRAEIAYLVDLVRGSPCLFLRNGDPYPGPEAADHIMEKYDYFRDEIKTAEDFIDRAASRSALSGRPYQVACPGAATIAARDWLRAALNDYRRQHAP